MRQPTVKLAIVFMLCMLSGCVHTSYTGDTATTDKLKDDLTEMVQKKFNDKLGYSCNISSIHTEVIDYIPNPKTRRIERMIELWIATGCDQTVSFYVGVKSDKTHGNLILFANYIR